MELKNHTLMFHTDGENYVAPKVLDHPQQLPAEDNVADIATQGKWHAVGIPMTLVVHSPGLLSSVKLVLIKIRENRRLGVMTNEVWIERMLQTAVESCDPDTREGGF